MFSPAQVEQLLRPVNPRRVQRNDKGMSHLAAYDVSAHLTRIFGFGGWRKEILALDLVAEDGIVDPNRKRVGWYVTYRCSMRLHVGGWWNDDGATGSAANLPDRGDAHDFAMKNAISYALKRCAKDLGDQFGLSLYNKGSLAALVGRTLAPNGAPFPQGASVLLVPEVDVDADLPELAPDWDETPAAWHRPGDAHAAAERADGLPTNADGSLSRSRTSDEEKDAAGVMTSAQQAEHTALRKGAAGRVAAADRDMITTFHPCDCANCRVRPNGPWMLANGEVDGAHPEGSPPDDPWYDTGQLPESWQPAEPLTPLSPGTISRSQSKTMHAQFTALGIKDRAARLAWTRRALGLDVLGSSGDLSHRQAGDLLAALEAARKVRPA